MGMEPKRFWIIGGGRYGKKSVDAVLKRSPGARVTVVDTDSATGRELAGRGVCFDCMDGVDFLVSNLGRGSDIDWIIPVVPVHLAYEWVKRKMAADRALASLPVPDGMAAMLPNPMRGNTGALYISYADFLCPENCPEPSDICTRTGKPRPGILHQSLTQLVWNDFSSVVVQSRQFAPGIGGYGPADLYTALDRVRAAAGPVLFSTACKCHGVVHAFTTQSQSV
jgi:hypothetical protein